MPAPAIPPPKNGPRCTICAHPQRKKINAALLAGASALSIQHDYGLSDSAVGRHRHNCIPAAATAAIQAKSLVGQGVEVNDLIEQSRTLYERCLRLLDDAETAVTIDNGGDPSVPQVLPPRDWNAITKMLREVRGTLELYGRFTGVLGGPGQTQPKDLLQHPAVQDFVTRIGAALLTTLTERLGDTTAQEILAEALTAIDAERRAATEQVPPQDRRLLKL